MTERDSGRYDAITDTWIDQQVRVDFAWGNIPMQPNDDRGMAQLDPALDSHIIAVAEYEGFPAFIQGTPYDDTIPNATMPNLYGMTVAEAESLLASLGFTDWITNTTTNGATAENDNTVSSQYPGAGTILNVTDRPAVVHFHYVAPAVNHNIAGIRPDLGHGVTHRNLYLFGRNSGLLINQQITLHDTGVANYNRPFDIVEIYNDDSFNTGGQRLVIRNTLMDGTGGDVTNVGTWTHP